MINVENAVAHTIASPIRVLVVDDHPLLRSGIRTLLEREPDLLIVSEAEDGQSAVDLTLQLEPQVVLMDVSLPKLGGADAAKLILARAPRQKILVLSAHEEAACARQLLDAGAAGYALKRSASDELVRAVRIVAAGGTYVDPSIAGALVAGVRRAGSAPIPIVSLSEREVEVVRLVAQGHTAKEMAASLGLSPRTLETYKARAMSKLNLHSRADLIRYALRCGWLWDS